MSHDQVPAHHVYAFLERARRPGLLRVIEHELVPHGACWYGVAAIRLHARAAKQFGFKQPVVAFVPPPGVSPLEGSRVLAGQLARRRGEVEPGVAIVITPDPASWQQSRCNYGLDTATLVPVDPRGPESRNAGALCNRLAESLYDDDAFRLAPPEVELRRQPAARAALDHLRSGDFVAIHGLRRCGKSPLLRLLGQQLAREGWLVVYADAARSGLGNADASEFLSLLGEATAAATRSGAAEVEARPAVAISPGADLAIERLTQAILEAKAPVCVVIDNIDEITPSSSSFPQWRDEFVPLWRGLAAARSATKRQSARFSVACGGVSAKWFRSASVGEGHNPAERVTHPAYVGALPPGAAQSLVMDLGARCGLRFAPDVAARLARACGDVPHWLRLLGTQIHQSLPTTNRPREVAWPDVEPVASEFAAGDGATAVRAAIDELIRLHPELRAALSALVEPTGPSIGADDLRLLRSYGLVSGAAPEHELAAVVRRGLELWHHNDRPAAAQEADPAAREQRQAVALTQAEWETAISEISSRRNSIERKLRALALHVYRQLCVANPSGGAPGPSWFTRGCKPERARDLQKLPPERLLQQLYWLELGAVLRHAWNSVHPLFKSEEQLSQHLTNLNFRPDAHAKSMDWFDLRTQRASLTWFEDRMAPHDLG